MKTRARQGVGGGGSVSPIGGEPVVTPEKKGESVAADNTVPQAKTGFTAPRVHQTLSEPATQQGHVVPISSRNASDPLFGATEVKDLKSAKVSDVFPAPQRPAGYRPREIWQGVIELGQGHEFARSLIGRQDLVEKLAGIGFDASVAAEWRDFYHSIDQFGESRDRPNPSAKGRAEFIDWVVVQLGGTSSGLWKGAAA